MERQELTFVFTLEGEQWACCLLGYECIATDNFGFGDTKKQALTDLLSQIDICDGKVSDL